MTDSDLKTCPKCHQAKPRTIEHFYATARRRGLSGYCICCHRAYYRDRYRARPYDALSAEERERHRLAARESNRRRRRVDPADYRPVAYAENRV